jgi:galactose mutarotase-like enzyme
MKNAKIFLSVRLWHPYFRAEKITNSIKKKATSYQTAGEMFKTPKGREIEKINKETYVVYDFQDENNDLVSAIQKANSFLFENYDFFNEIKKTGGRCDYYITVDTDNKYAFVIPPDVFKDCSRLDVNLGVEIYFDQELEKSRFT